MKYNIKYKNTKKEKMSKEWTIYEISDVAEVIGGGTPSTKVPEYWNGEIPWLSIKDFNNDIRVVYKTEKNITELGLNNSSTKLLNKSDIVISARGTVGAITQLGKSMAFNQSCYGLRAKNNVINDFLYYLLKYKLSLVEKLVHGSVFNTITINTFKYIKAKIPSVKVL